MRSNIVFQLISLFYISLVTVVFCLKKKLDTAENRIYSLLIVANMIGAILDIASIEGAYLFGTNFLTILVCKLYLLYLVAYVLIFSIYAILISRKIDSSEEKLQFYKKISKKFLALYIFIIIIMLAVPTEIYCKGDSMYSYGVGPMLTYIICGSCVLSWNFILIKYRKSLSMRKSIPLIAAILSDLIATGIQFILPQYLLVTSASIFTAVIMFFTVFTIENPDLKLVSELSLAKQQAEKSSNAKSEFLSSMSHELRTPLNAIVGLSTMIKNGDDINEIHNDANDILNASNNLLELVDGILNINMLDASNVDLLENNYSPKSLFDSLCKITKIRIGSKPVELKYSYSNNIPQILIGDSDKIRVLVSNLLSNAVKYTVDGYISFIVDCITNKNTIDLKITISDTGKGIKEEDINNIFEKFYRSKENKDSDIEGTGLGLAIVKSIVDLMDGTIEVKSTYGESTTFIVTVTQKYVKNDEAITEEHSLNDNDIEIL